MSLQEEKLKAKLLEIMDKAVEELTETTEWSAYNVWVGNNFELIITDAAFNVIKSAKDLQDYMYQNFTITEE